VKVLLAGAILAPGKRMVTAILHIMGHSTSSDLQTYHRVLNRAVWSPLTASRLLLRFVVAVLIPRGIVVLGLEDTTHRRGKQIHATGIYRDPVRSSHSHMVKASGVRWLACMVLVPLSWTHRIWALPLLTVLCPSERFDAQRGRRPQALTERAWQIMRRVVRWLPRQAMVFVADSSFAALELLAQVKTLPGASVITRLRLDAALYAPPSLRLPGTTGRPRLTGKRRPTLEAVLADERTAWTTVLVEQWYGKGPREVEGATDTAVWYHTGKPPVALRWVLIRDPQRVFAPQALRSTHLAYTPEQIVSWVVRRWTMEVTCEEARAHLGMETPRQWKARAIARTTPALLSLDSIVTLTAHLLLAKSLSEKVRLWLPDASPSVESWQSGSTFQSSRARPRSLCSTGASGSASRMSVRRSTAIVRPESPGCAGGVSQS
jgi:hypothetical protein